MLPLLLLLGGGRKGDLWISLKELILHIFSSVGGWKYFQHNHVSSKAGNQLILSFCFVFHVAARTGWESISNVCIPDINTRMWCLTLLVVVDNAEFQEGKEIVCFHQKTAICLSDKTLDIIFNVPSFLFVCVFLCFSSFFFSNHRLIFCLCSSENWLAH